MTKSWDFKGIWNRTVTGLQSDLRTEHFQVCRLHIQLEWTQDLWQDTMQP